MTFEDTREAASFDPTEGDFRAMLHHSTTSNAYPNIESNHINLRLAQDEFLYSLTNDISSHAVQSWRDTTHHAPMWHGIYVSY